MSRHRLAGPLLGLGAMSAALAAPTGLFVSLSPKDPALACGAALTPALTFGAPPKNTKSLALILWDQAPDKLTGRWSVFDLPPSTGQLAAVKAPAQHVAGGRAATNETGRPGYSAICARGRHDVYVDLYALDVPSLDLPAGAPLQRVHALIRRHKIVEAKAHLTLEVK